MEKINNDNSSLLKEAMQLWSGWRISPIPRRDESCLVNRYGKQTSCEILSKIHLLEEEFYRSDARFIASNVNEMGEIAKAQFCYTHPELDTGISDILSWCYTFDYK